MHVRRELARATVIHGAKPGADLAVSWVTHCNGLGRAPVDTQAIHPHILDDLHPLRHICAM